jgi:integrase
MTKSYFWSVCHTVFSKIGPTDGNNCWTVSKGRDDGVSAHRVWVRDMKNPGDKKGNHVLCELTSEAVRIIDSMPRTTAEIFPYTTDAIGAAFTRACSHLEIADLHFHDLRHEGISRLFEMGRTIPQVAAVSGHRSWSSLQRYTHLRETGDKYLSWGWLPTVTSAPAAQHDAIAR